MNLAKLSISRPIFIACTVILLLVVGYISLKRLPVDLYPDVTIPIVVVNTIYEGAGPAEVETQISKPLEDTIATVAGIDSLRSISREGSSTIVAEFDLKVDVKYAEQQIRDRVSSAKRRLPDDIEEPIIRTVDPADQPVLVISVSADLPEAELYDLADEVIVPRLTQVDKVGLVEILGARSREIHVELDKRKLLHYQISASQVADKIGQSGRNTPIGKTDRDGLESTYRAVSEFRNLKSIESTIVRFTGNENPIAVRDLGKVTDTLEDERSRTFVDGQRALLIYAYRQSKANTVAVTDGLTAQVEELNKTLKDTKGHPKLRVVRDGSAPIRANIFDVKEAIFIGILLTIIVVYFFLGSARSTLITGMALPNSLLGAFIVMAMAGFSVNIMTLLALSLAVGLLIDDSIVVRENIYRHLEMGKSAHKAAYEGTVEVTLAVIATTLTVLAVFGPIGFLEGVVGQYLKEFGLTVCFAMLISLFDALTIAPMLSAYFAKTDGHGLKKKSQFILSRWNEKALKSFDRFQTFLEQHYERLLHLVLKWPISFIVANIFIFVGSIYLLKYIPKTFLPAQDNGEFSVNMDLPPGTSLDAMSKLTLEVDNILRQQKEVDMTVTTIGNRDEANTSEIFVKLVPSNQRKMNTSQYKDYVRELLKPYTHANPQVGDGGGRGGGGQRAFSLNIVGPDLKSLEEYSNKLLAKLKTHPALKDVDTSFRPGKPEIQVILDEAKAEQVGVASARLGSELRLYVQGETPALFRVDDREYDVRVRMQPDQRFLKDEFKSIMVPNINDTLVPLSSIASIVETTAPTTILRQDRARYIQLSGDVNPEGPGLGGAISYVHELTKGELKPPQGITYAFVGQAKRFGELMMNMFVAMGLGILFIYLVLSSLYESFITPFSIMLVFPLAACGAFLALFVTGSTLDLFSMIGCVMLLGLATKNSILLVDYANQQVNDGKSLKEAILIAGRTRLRPILMTSFALIAGMVPVAIGLNEASKQRTSMGIAIIGGTITSTLLSLIVVPAAYSYIERFRMFVNRLFFKYIGSRGETEPEKPEPPAPPLPESWNESKTLDII